MKTCSIRHKPVKRDNSILKYYVLVSDEAVFQI